MNEKNFEMCEDAEVVLVESAAEVGKKSVKKPLIGILVATAVAGVVIVARKRRKKIYELMEKKLTKAGYTVLEPRDITIEDDSNENKETNN